MRDLQILSELGFNVIVANTFFKIPLGCDVYFSWWSSGSVLPLIKALISRSPILTIAGGNESMLYRDSISSAPMGYLQSPFWKKIATRLSLRYSTRVVVVSNFMLADVRRLGAKNPLVIHNCVDTKFYCAANEPRTYITSIFRMDKDSARVKRADIYFHAISITVKRFPFQKFIIIGKKGNDFYRINNLIHALDIDRNIIFIDEVDNLTVRSWLQKSILYVQISDTETFGLAIAEAMSCEVPVLVSKSGAIPEVVGEEGIYVDHNCEENVAYEMIKLLNMDKTSVKKIGHNLRQRVLHKFSYEMRMAKLNTLLSDVL